MGAVSYGNVMLFAGGYDGASFFSEVDYFDGFGVTWSANHTQLPSGPRAFMGTTSAARGHMLFAGGETAQGVPTNAVDVWDVPNHGWLSPGFPSLTLSQPRSRLAAAAVDVFAIFAGGMAANSQ
jgi:hypothetical protein